MSTSHATLSAAADDRKARLAKLKYLKRKQPADEVVAPESERTIPSPPPPAAAVEEIDVARIHLSGRNYDVETKGPKLGFEAPPTQNMEGPTLEEQAAAVEEEIRRRAAEDENNDKGIDLFKLQPKKPNWDLKRDLDKKLETLNVRTDNAIARLVRERIANAQAAAKQPERPAADGEGGEEAAGVDGVILVEGLRVREREEEEEERREREEEDIL